MLRSGDSSASQHPFSPQSRQVKADTPSTLFSLLPPGWSLTWPTISPDAVSSRRSSKGSRETGVCIGVGVCVWGGEGSCIAGDGERQGGSSRRKLGPLLVPGSSLHIIFFSSPSLYFILSSLYPLVHPVDSSTIFLSPYYSRCGDIVVNTTKCLFS